jgi:hypothetical protein
MDKDRIPKVIEHASQLREIVAQLDIITGDISRAPFSKFLPAWQIISENATSDSRSGDSI